MMILENLLVKRLSIIFIFVSIYGCSQPTGIIKVIDMITVSESPRPLSIEGLIKIEDVAFLETREESLIKLTQKAIYDNENFYVRTGNIIHRFSDNGKYLNSIGTVGRGPGEYTGLIDFAVNSHLNLILILTGHPQSVFMYDPSGQFKGHFRIERASVSIRELPRDSYDSI